MCTEPYSHISITLIYRTHLIYWLINEVFPTLKISNIYVIPYPLSPRMISLRRTFFLEAMLSFVDVPLFWPDFLNSMKQGEAACWRSATGREVTLKFNGRHSREVQLLSGRDWLWPLVTGLYNVDFRGNTICRVYIYYIWMPEKYLIKHSELWNSLCTLSHDKCWCSLSSVNHGNKTEFSINTWLWC